MLYLILHKVWASCKTSPSDAWLPWFLTMKPTSAMIWWLIWLTSSRMLQLSIVCYSLIKFSWANPLVCNTVTIHVSIVKNIQTSLSMIYHNTSGDNDSDRASRRLYVNQPRRFCSWPWLLKKKPTSHPLPRFCRNWLSCSGGMCSATSATLCRPWNTNSTKTPLGHLDYI